MTYLLLRNSLTVLLKILLKPVCVQIRMVIRFLLARYSQQVIGILFIDYLIFVAIVGMALFNSLKEEFCALSCKQ